MLLPVRHHSPACARMVREAILRTSPAAVLIEGPVDFNDRIDELFLGHRLPISIFSYVAWEGGARQGAYYPMCEYSPEWQALLAAREYGAVVRFIDLPFALRGSSDGNTHLYADDRLRGSDYVEALCQALEVENFDDAWDLIAEQDAGLSGEQVRERVANYCRCLRDMDGEAVSPRDLQREEFMASQIRVAWNEFGKERVLVITGGYHTSGLESLLANEEGPVASPVEWPEEIVERGIALTPYSYERLDSLTGYDAGMPSPGFYHEAWKRSEHPVHDKLLVAMAARLREAKQTVSTADLIAVEACAQALASLRGHTRVWRRDLMDALIAALVKDDVHATHPFVRAMEAVLRGGERGRLADGSPVPPLVRDIRNRLAEAGLEPEQKAATVELALTKADALDKSRLLHGLRVLGIPGFDRIAGVDFSSRDDLSTLTETWRVRWLPDQDAGMIEASRYGSAFEEAVAACLREKAGKLERDAAGGAALLLDAVLVGVMETATELRRQVAVLIHNDGELASLATAMDHLLHLFAWDDLFGTKGSLETGELLKEAFDRAVWLLESGGPASTREQEVEAVRLTRDVFERAEQPMRLNRLEFTGVLERVQADSAASPPLRGACAGALWSLHAADGESIKRDLRLFSSPEHLGDYLTGLFALAREEVQRNPALIAAVNEVVTGWNDDAFLTALPSLRLAFMYFTGREKSYLARELFAGEKTDSVEELRPLAVGPAEAAEAMAFEVALFALAERYGVNLDPKMEVTP
jgi:hypothetical protein